MLPPAMQFDLRPRRHRVWLRAALLAILAGVATGAMVSLKPRQAELERLNLALAEVRSSATASASRLDSDASTSASSLTTAGKDGALFALPVQPRLLEIENCTDAKAIVTRIEHDASDQATSIELGVSEADAVRALLECLNSSVPGQPAWRLISVETQTAVPQVGATVGQRVVLRYP